MRAETRYRGRREEGHCTFLGTTRPDLPTIQGGENGSNYQPKEQSQVTARIPSIYVIDVEVYYHS